MPTQDPSDRASRPAERTSCSAGNTSSASQGNHLCCATHLVDQQTRRREQAPRPHSHEVFPLMPRTQTDRRADHSRCPTRMIDMIRECELSADGYVGNRQVGIPHDQRTVQHEPSMVQARPPDQPPCADNRSACSKPSPRADHASCTRHKPLAAKIHRSIPRVEARRR